MQIRRAIMAVAAAVVMAAVPSALKAQGSSINTFSPYSLYGLGDLATQGPAWLRSMGGAGVAYTSVSQINTLNPAAVTGMPGRAFIFTVGMEGQNHYLRNKHTKSSYNTFNYNSIAMQFPLAERLYMGLSLSPYSNVGYRIDLLESNPEILAGRFRSIRYNYFGEGDINLGRLTLGVELTENLSLGAEMLYYFGNIRRHYNVEIDAFPSEGTFADTRIRREERISRVQSKFGVQYNKKSGTRRLALGATFEPRGDLRPKVTNYAEMGYVVPTMLEMNSFMGDDLELPGVFSAGAFLHTRRMSIGVDYIFSNWEGKNEGRQVAGQGGNNFRMEFRNTNEVRVGLQYTPNAYDIRSAFKRLTYRFGVRYSDYYMRFNDTDINDMAVTLGVGIPTRQGSLSSINVGLELGRKGTTRNNLIRADYFNVTVGLSLFGDDYWFVKRRYD